MEESGGRIGFSIPAEVRSSQAAPQLSTRHHFFRADFQSRISIWSCGLTGQFDGWTTPLFQGEFRDSSGFRYFNDKYRLSRNMFTLETNCLPRRDRQLQIKVVETRTGATLGNMKIENPFFRSSIAEWMPRTDDSIQERSELKVQFMGLSVKPAARAHTSKSEWYPIPPEIGIDRRVSSNADEWVGHHDNAWLEDATGNRGLWISPNEPVWKAVIEVSRRSQAPHPTEMTTPIEQSESRREGNWK